MKEKEFANKMIKDYSEEETTKLDELKSLDKKVKKPATVFAYVFGIIASLILGVGMCLAMKVIGGSSLFMAIGIVVGLIGITLCGVNYLIYKRRIESRRKLYADKILEISNQILNGEI